ncbi:MAG: UDPGP type 1 family protein [Ruminococcus sp.]|nr:UDPGP type 1 family protein [Ruminococcus sp.]
MLRLNEAKKILEKYNQMHILKYYDELSEEEKANLLTQIESADFSVLESLDSSEEFGGKRGSFEPLGAVTADEIEKNHDVFSEVGLDAIRQGKAAAVLLAGGQSTRLGFDKPKGMYNMGVEHEVYIFQCLMNNLLDVVRQAGAWIPLYIMTSEKNYGETVEFFREKNNFGYNGEYIKFFVQDMAVSTDCDGKVLMESKCSISMSPNGNGGWFSSIVRAGLLEEIKNKGVEWLNVFSVDNVLQRMADPAFLGAVILSGCQSGGKVVSRAAPDEKVGVLCLEDGKPSIVEYYEMTEEMRTRCEPDGTLSYNYGVILNYLFNVNKLEEIADNKMPIHVVKKKIPYMDETGEMIKPDEPNGYKFETLVLDMIHMQDSCLSYEVDRRREFAPIKNLSGVDSVDTARILLAKNGVEL